ncbi:hypothetical protein EJ02DRAFT_423663 [Clathrospora elynae]|uniref:Rhodanese domain-containing protein n=1 Tax=Clathrospora elynae TaxID=706981 RepID=A0A6A5SME4_9PLEO|nr:hypothetical protein EJ02DRAFT_423663 [Clathrospora elynae]
MPAQSLLIDVRSPSEFTTGALTTDIAQTVNIEYTSIDQLLAIYAARGITVSKSDNITLYCRSGRRSDIARKTLRGMGFANVRDIGGLEDARKVLDREEVGRQLEGGMGAVQVTDKEVTRDYVEDAKRNVRVKSFSALMDGLKALDG